MTRWCWGLATAAVAVLVACGGGGNRDGGGSPSFYLPPTSVSPPPSAPSKTSADCFNEADFHEGTVLEVRRGSSSLVGPTVRTKIVTSTRESFAQANPITFLHSSPDISDTNGGTSKTYRDIIGGNVVDYGSLGKSSVTNYADSVWTNEPPITMPVAFEEGQTVHVDYVLNIALSDGQSNTRTPTGVSQTYLGREIIQTPVGTFSTCKFLVVTQAEGSPLTKEQKWIAAEGPYRGQELKWGSPDQNDSWIVRDITYTPK